MKILENFIFIGELKFTKKFGTLQKWDHGQTLSCVFLYFRKWAPQGKNPGKGLKYIGEKN